jgi:RNA polymerase sigma-70 factor, ECF subfamily
MLKNFTHDLALFQSMKRGNRLALTSLFSHHYERLCTFAFQYVRNKEEAEEIVSTVFFSLWQNRERLIIDKNVKAYLYTCVKNESLSILKKRQPFFTDLDDVLMIHADNHDRPDYSYEYSEADAYFQHIVNGLPLRCKQIFVLNRYENLKYKEISDLLEITEKTVENQVCKALVIVREKMRQFYTEIR